MSISWASRAVIAGAAVLILAGTARAAETADEPGATAGALCGPALAAPARPLPTAREAAARGALTVLAIGSSSTAGVGAGAGPAYPAQLKALIAAERPDVAVALAARGVGGETAVGAQERLAEALAETGASLVVWQIGTNDARSRSPLRAMLEALLDGVETARSAGADVVLIDPQHYPKAEGDGRYTAHVAALHEIARRLDLPIVPRYGRMRAAAAAGADLLAGDRFHMNADGHACLARDAADVILPALLPALGPAAAPSGG